MLGAYVLAVVPGASRELGCIPSVPPWTALSLHWGGTFLSHVASTLAPEALEGAGILPI